MHAVIHKRCRILLLALLYIKKKRNKKNILNMQKNKKILSTSYTIIKTTIRKLA